MASGAGTREFVVTIDGPAGAGKSSVARKLAQRFGYAFLDTGAMYRVVTLACLRQNVSFGAAESLTEIAENLEIQFDGDRILMNGEDVSDAIRMPEVNANIRYIADNNTIRRLLTTLQSKIAAGREIVTEGRDQGTEVFPHAGCKIFLTAKPETRARRRHLELLDRGHVIDYQEVLEAQQKRDQEDSQRPVGALRPAEDAEIVYTDDMNQEAVIDKLADIVRSRLQPSEPPRPSH